MLHYPVIEKEKSKVAKVPVESDEVVRRRKKYYAYAIAVMLATKSGLRADFDNLDAELRTEVNLQKLIAYNLYNTTSGIQNGQLATSDLPTGDPVIDDVVNRLDYPAILIGWETIKQASTAIHYTILSMLDYEPGGSCPGYLEQPDLLRRMGVAGAANPNPPAATDED